MERRRMPLFYTIMWAFFTVLNVWTWWNYENFDDQIVKFPIWVYWVTIPSTAAFAAASFIFWRKQRG